MQNKTLTLQEAIDAGYLRAEEYTLEGEKYIGFFENSDLLDSPFISVPSQKNWESELKDVRVIMQAIPKKTVYFITGVIFL